MGFIFPLTLLYWVSLHTSQSLIDLSDFLVVIMGLYISWRKKEFSTLFKGFQPALLWILWPIVIVLGFIFGAPVELKSAVKLTLEFRWILHFLCWLYLLNKLEFSHKQVRVLVWIFLGLCLLDLILYFVNFERDPRAGGLFGHSMPFAHSMGPAALLFGFICLKQVTNSSLSFINRLIYFLVPMLSSGLVILSLTRGIWLSFVFASLVATLLLSWRRFLQAVFAIAIVSTVLFFGFSRIQSRVLGTTGAESQSNNERLVYWKANLDMFKDYPIFGIGYSQNNLHLQDYIKKQGLNWEAETHAHNQYIHFLAGTGFLGLVCFLLFIGSLLLKMLKSLWTQRTSNNKSDHYYLVLGAFAGLICFLVGSLTESNFSISKNRFMFLFIAGIGYILASKTDKQGQ